VAFLGGVNDDLLSGVLSIARLFIVGGLGPEAWERNQAQAAAAARAKLDAQLASLAGLIECTEKRRAGFVFLHDFLIGDLPGGRGSDRNAMLATRRTFIEQHGGTFVDLHDAFRDEIGIAWFNDFVHFSRIGHERIAALACHAFE
jgi:hypothetical protein